MARGKVAAQVGPALARYLRLRGHHAVEGAADVGKVERDRRRRLALELGEAEDRRAQVALAAVREGRVTGKPIENGLQRRPGRWPGEGGLGFIGLLLSGPLGSGSDPGGQGVTFGNTIIAQMGLLLDESIPDNPEKT